MVKNLYIILFTFLSVSCFAQNAEKLTVKTLAPIMIKYNNVEELLKPKEINNAIELQVKVKNNNYQIFTQVSSSNASYAESFNNKVSLRLQNHNSYNANVRDEVLLSETPQLLLTQPSVEHTEHFDFYYDLVIQPFTTFVSPGAYNIYITFTMTRP